MAKLFNLARMSSATAGTGTITLGSAVPGYLTFAQAGVSNGDVVDYAIKDGSNSEHGTGTYASSGTTLSRSVTRSTNSNNAISLSGTAEVFISPRAETLNDASLIATGTMDGARLGSVTTARGVALFEGNGTGLGNTGAGTVGQALISGGSGADPSYKSGTRVLLNTLTASSSATLSDTTNFTSAYIDYELVFENVLPASGSNTLQLQVHSGGSFQTSSYVTNVLVAFSTTVAAAALTTHLQLSTGGTQHNAGPGISGTVRIFGPVSGTSAARQMTAAMSGNNSTPNALIVHSNGYWNNTAAITGFQVLFSSGNIASGTIKVYGML